MQSNNESIRNVADIARRIISGESPEAIAEALKGNQHKIDKNKNNKIDAEDFKMLRKEEEEVCEKCGCNPCECAVEEETEVVEESEQIDEVKMADLPSRKVQGKSYGASKPKANPFDVLKGPKSKDLDAIKKDEKKMVPDWARGPNESVSTFSAMLESYKQDGLKSLAKMNKLKEEPDNEQFTKEVEEVKKKASEKKSPEDEARVAKGQVDAVKVEEEVEQIDETPKVDQGLSGKEKVAARAGRADHLYNFKTGNTTGGQWRGKTEPSPYKDSNVAKSGERKGLITKSAIQKTKDDIKSRLNKEEVEQIEEREMTDSEMKKREEIVKSMKKGMAGFKERYGDRAKNVMYATATKQAMKEENDEEV